MFYVLLLKILVNQSDFMWKQPPKGVLRKRCSENMQQIYRRTPIPKCDFNKVALRLIEVTLRHGCSPVNLLHIFRTPLTKNTSGRMLLFMVKDFFYNFLRDLLRFF